MATVMATAPFCAETARAVSFRARSPRVAAPIRRCSAVKRCAATTRCIAAPPRPNEQQAAAPSLTRLVLDRRGQQPELITREAVQALEAELDNGPSVAALRRFNDALRDLPADQWEARLAPVMHELAYNLESFNPAFTAVLLKVQSTIGISDYCRRDAALKNLIQPLAGEYGMHNGQEQACTHRELFSCFYFDLMHRPLEAELARDPAPPAAAAFFAKMMADITTGGGGQVTGPMDQAVYALGYNLAIEYLADYEKTWMLDSFRHLDEKVLQPQGRGLSEWLFLEVHAEGEAEHAAIGHAAVTSFVPSAQAPALAAAMRDHDRDFAAYYNYLADLLLAA